MIVVVSVIRIMMINKLLLMIFRIGVMLFF